MPKNKFSSILLLYGLGLGINRILAALLLPLLTNALIPAEYGLWTLLQSLYLILLVIAVHGMDEAVIRFTSTDKEDRRGIFSAAFFGALFAVGVLSLLCYMPLKTILPPGPQGNYRCALFFLWLSADVLSLIASAYFRAVERPYPVTLFLAGQNILLIFLLWLLTVNHPGGVNGILEAQAATALLSFLFWLPFILKEKIPKPPFILYQRLFVFAIPLMGINALSLLTNYLDRFLVNSFLGEAMTGIYGVAYKLGMMTFLLLSAFRMAWYPKFYALYQEQGRDAAIRYSRKTLPLLLLMMGTAALFITTFSGQIAAIPVPGGTFIGKEFWAGLPIVGLVALAYVFDSLATLLDAFLYFEKRFRLLFIATGVSLGVNIALNLVLIKPFGLVGAALATLAAYIILFLAIQYINVRKMNIRILSAKSRVLIIYIVMVNWAGQAIPSTGGKWLLFAAHVGLAIALFLHGRQNHSHEQTA